LEVTRPIFVEATVAILRAVVTSLAAVGAIKINKIINLISPNKTVLLHESKVLPLIKFNPRFFTLYPV
jgi:hypothetical protein